MVDYDLSRLSSRSFEHLIQALAAKVLGPRIMIFGDGPDGGREATFDWRIPFPSIDDGWEGYGVIQAKFLQKLGSTSQNGKWALSQLRSELQKYLDPDTKLRPPEYFIFATNVVLTPVNESGSKDEVIAEIEAFKAQVALKDYDVWDYDKIRVFLDNNEDVRRAYAAWITPGDVLAAMIERLSGRAPDLEETLFSFLQKELVSDQFVNLELAGHDPRERIPLAPVFVDLPTLDRPHEDQAPELEDDGIYVLREDSSEDEGRGFIKEILEVSSERLDPHSLATNSIAQGTDTGDRPQPRERFVLIGGPGQGKSTVSQFICQIFRTSIISGRPDTTLSPEARDALSLIRASCEQEEIQFLPVPRFPFRIVLNEYASALSTNSSQDVNSIFSYLAKQIQTRTNRETSATEVRQWMAHYPSIIIFDGLDEVPSSSNRDEVLKSVQEFWIDAASSNADVLAIATSRPQGYNEDFSRRYYQHKWLVPLSRELGMHFAKRLADARYGTDSDRKERVLIRLDRAFENASTFRLMRSPLQVTIMTALVDQMGQPPQAQWTLFKSYYDVIYRREVERDIPASIILRDYQPDITAIHNRVGLLLQIDSERSGRTDSKLSAQRFRLLVEGRLEEEGHQGDELLNLAERIFTAALERLVFLVGLESDQVGFEIRSLQEFMAAESLMEGSDQEVGRRLHEIAPIPSWRNVFLFASGKCFADRQHLRDQILSICVLLNETNGDEIAGMCLVGSELAIELLDDGSIRNQPKYIQGFARIAIRALDAPNSQLHAQLSHSYFPELEDLFFEEIARRLSDDRAIVRFGGLECLIHLAGARVSWAEEMAETHWPNDPETEYRLLSRGNGARHNQWAFNKILDLIPRMSIARLPELSHSYTVEPQEIPPEQKDLGNILQNYRRDNPAQISFLQTRFMLFPFAQDVVDSILRLPQSKALEECHVTWKICESAARFMEDPSHEGLSSALREIAPLLNESTKFDTFPWNIFLPWPILACLEMCTENGQLLELADRAASGALGTTSDWAAAESRWIEKGISIDDILSMTDDRLPFDRGTATLGFPTTLHLWPGVWIDQESTLLESLFELFRKIEGSQSRLFVARLIEIAILQGELFVAARERVTPPTHTLQDVRAILEVLPPGRNVPISIVIHRLGEPSQDLSEFLTMMAGRKNRFLVYNLSEVFREEQANVLDRTFRELDDNSVLLPILAALAESGSLTSQIVGVFDPENLDDLEAKESALIVMLGQEMWNTDRTDKLIELIREIGAMSDKFYDRVINTIRNSRPTGQFLERFVIDLEGILPTDSYITRQRYRLLLRDLLTRRTSKFSDHTESERFGLPAGVVKRLQA